MNTQSGFLIPNYLPNDRLGFPSAYFNGMPDSQCAKTNASISLANVSQALTACRHCQTLRTPSKGHGFCLPRAWSLMGRLSPLPLTPSLFTDKASESSGHALLPTSSSLPNLAMGRSYTIFIPLPIPKSDLLILAS